MGEFPDIKGEFLKAENFQDNPIVVTYKTFDYEANEDDGPDSKKKNKLTWKQKLKYCLRYSYPKYAVDEAGEAILGDEGKPFMNRYFLEDYPHGYTIKYSFEEGVLTSGSLPLFKCFCRIKPKPGESIEISRTGKDKETKWSVVRVKYSDAAPAVQSEEEEAPEVPF